MFKSKKIAELFCLSNILVGMTMGFAFGAIIERFTEDALDKAAIKYLRNKMKNKTR